MIHLLSIKNWIQLSHYYTGPNMQQYYSMVINEKNPYKKFVKKLTQTIASPVIMIEWLKQTFHVKENILTQQVHRESEKGSMM